MEVAADKHDIAALLRARADVYPSLGRVLRTGYYNRVFGLACCLLLAFGCASTTERPEPQFRVGQENRPFLISPLTGYPRGVAPVTTQQLEGGFMALVRDGNFSSARQASQALLDINPTLHPAELLGLQVKFTDGQYAEVAEALDELVVKVPNYFAALVLRARVAELLNDIPRAFEIYWSVQSNHLPSASKVNRLRVQALAGARQDTQAALDSGHLQKAVEIAERLQTWAPGELPTLRIRQAVAVALDDPGAELSVLRELGRLSPKDVEVAQRRAVLETEVGDAGLGLGILQRLVAQYPENAEMAELLSRAKFRWRLQVLPEAVRDLADLEVLNRADFAALLYWLFPEIRYGKPVSGRIANDISSHAFRDEIVKVANLGLIEIDANLHRFSPEVSLTRGATFRGFLALFELAEDQPACLGNWRQSLNSSVDFVCQAAASCGLIPSLADCLPEAEVSGRAVVEMGRLAQKQLGIK